jgi:uncharacterized protein (TIGR02996 family)
MPSSSSEYEALYAAVCASPADDTPRLVLADWLDEHNDPHRAAFIRAEVELARLRETDPHAAAVVTFRYSVGCGVWQSYAEASAISPGVGRMAELAKKATASGAKAEARWKAVFGKRKAGRIISFERGFPHTIAISNALQYAKAAAKQSGEKLPGYRLSVYRGNADGFDELLACGCLSHADGFTLFGVDSPELVRKLGARPEARNFRSLYLDLNAANPDILTPVATEPNWAGLTSLIFHSSLYRAVDAIDLPAKFFEAKHLGNLTYLSLALHGLSGASVAGLMKLGLSRLRTLDIHSNTVDAAGARVLANGEFPELRSINLGSNEIGNAGAAALAASRKLPALAALYVSGNDITDPKAFASLIAGPAFPVLTGLNLRDNRAGELDAKMLASEGRGPTLRLLSLRHCSLSAQAMAALASAPTLIKLVAIDLAGNKIGDEGAAAIAASKYSQLTCIDLGTNGITAKGVKALLAWPGLAKLAHLDLGDNPIGLEGAKALVACTTLKKCRKLTVPADPKHMPEEGLKLLQAKYGKRLERSY